MYQHVKSILLSYLKGVFSESWKAVVHGASGAGVDYYLSNLICFTQLRRPIWLNYTHQGWIDEKTNFQITVFTIFNT